MKFTIYTGPNCGWCRQAKDLLNRKLISFEELTVEELKTRMPEARTIPQIFVGDQHIGGYKELVNFLSETDTSNS